MYPPSKGFTVGMPVEGHPEAQVTIGGGAPVAVQTMCNTHTRDIEASLAQCREMARAGAALIRLTTQGPKEVEALAEIRSRLREEGIFTPLVADVHFRSDVARAAAAVADKVRINPGNFAAEHDRACSEFFRLLECCRSSGAAIRIGLNHGSLGERILNRWGGTPQAMAEAAMEWLRMCREADFDRVAVSLKASNTVVMVEAYRHLAAAMEREFGFRYPFHLGVTEAGNGDEGRLKSAVGIGTLLREGLGDTVRVSLTENPVNEISAGYKIVEGAAGCRKASESAASPHDALYPFGADSGEGSGRGPDALPASGRNGWLDAPDRETLLIRAALLHGPGLLAGGDCDIPLEGASVAGVPLGEAEKEELRDMLLQACRRRFTRPEYIACPGCGRTMYDLEEVFNEVKRRTAHLGGVKIAVMGCIVNGPGEMADADWGYVGESGGCVSIFKGKEAVARRVPQGEAIDILLRLIAEDGDPVPAAPAL